MDLVKLDGYNRIYSVNVFQDEYRKLFGNSRVEYERCRKKLRANLRILDNSRRETILTYYQFEKIEGEDLYSIRHINESNPRVIFAYVSKRGNIVLLSACKEKSTHDYQPALRKAKERLKDLEEQKNDR